MKKSKYDYNTKIVTSEEMTLEEIENRLLLAEDVCKAYDKFLHADIGEQSEKSEEELEAKFRVWFLQKSEDGR